MKHRQGYPGEGIDKRHIYEVWGDLVENAADSGPSVIAYIRRYLEESSVAKDFDCREFHAVEDDRPYLTFSWGNFFAQIDARDFGAHLDIYAILGIEKGLLDVPDPSARLGALEVEDRRYIQVFQSLLKFAMEDAMTALDEGRL
jgi:hypothetical protein